MDLQEFVTETLSQIINGVVEAQEIARKHGAEVNPYLMGDLSVKSAHGMIPTKRSGMTAQIVSFDVALTVKEGTGTKGGIGIFAGAVNLGSSGQSNAENSSVSHVRFSVPVSLPHQAAS